MFAGPTAYLIAHEKTFSVENAHEKDILVWWSLVSSPVAIYDCTSPLAIYNRTHFLPCAIPVFYLHTPTKLLLLNKRVREMMYLSALSNQIYDYLAHLTKFMY